MGGGRDLGGDAEVWEDETDEHDVAESILVTVTGPRRVTRPCGTAAAAAAPLTESCLLRVPAARERGVMQSIWKTSSSCAAAAAAAATSAGSLMDGGASATVVCTPMVSQALGRVVATAGGAKPCDTSSSSSNCLGVLRGVSLADACNATAAPARARVAASPLSSLSSPSEAASAAAAAATAEAASAMAVAAPPLPLLLLTGGRPASDWSHQVTALTLVSSAPSLSLRLASEKISKTAAVPSLAWVKVAAVLPNVGREGALPRGVPCPL
mmetsp:Transcript_10063/g.22563  ORF Transcript_10063/g.22563 Transcript_10063/m.22563 type:complete len:269 (-) Transcript_10063:330-1136(-)